VFASVGIYVRRKLVRWHRFVHEFRMSRITPEELKEKLDAGEKVLVIDVHGGRDGLRGHQGIPGAVCIDPRRLGQRANHDGRMPIPPILRDCEVVLYCTTPHELTSARLALQLRHRGFEHVRPLAGGLRAWRERGFPVTLVILCGADELCRWTALSAYGELRAVLCAQYPGRQRSALDPRKVLSRVMALNLRCATTSSCCGEVTNHANVPQLSPSEGD